jgi:hypothetical protein
MLEMEADRLRRRLAMRPKGYREEPLGRKARGGKRVVRQSPKF